VINAGAMRHQVELQVRSTVQDAAGERADVWNVFAQRRAALMRTPGQEVFAAAQRAGRVPVVIRMRWLAGVTDAMRLVFRCGCCAGRGVHDVKSAIDEAGRNEELVVTAEEHPEEAP
jgi:head-tail adaptor